MKDSSQDFIRAIVTRVIERMPALLDHGFTADGTSIPPLPALAVPAQTVAPGQPLPLCAVMYEDAPGTTPTVALTDITAAGVDTIALAGPITFPDGDDTVQVPVSFAALTLAMDWTTTSQCVPAGQPGATPAATVHGGTLALRFTAVSATVTVVLSPDPVRVTSLAVAIIDDASWAAQPRLDPATDVTYDATMSSEQQTVIDDVLGSPVFAQLFRDHARTALQQPDVTDRITCMLDQALAGL